MVAMTVRELTEIPFLRVRVLAGESGLRNTISWAHACEADRPWEWLESGDLLLTVGLCVPSAPRDQVQFVETLAAANISGIGISEGMHAPPVSPAMLNAADRVALPLLSTAFEVPFVQISRTVAGANHGSEHLRLVKTVRIYDSLRAAAIHSSSASELLEKLGQEIHCGLAVCTNDRGAHVFEGAKPLGSGLRDAFLEEVLSRGGVVPGILRLSADGVKALVVPVPAPRPVSLIAVPRGSEIPPYAILQHVATVAALEFERLLAAREERRRLGAEALDQMLDDLLGPRAVAASLQSHGLDPGHLVMLVAQRSGELDDKSCLHHALAERQIPHMLLRRNKLLHCLVSGCETNRAVDDAVELLAETGMQIGISESFTRHEAVPEAARQARWALETAKAEDARCCRYGEQYRNGGPRSITEARAMVDRVLGPILRYDEAHGTELAQSLAMFLRCDRSWQRAASELCVHKQTLVYRMRRVEELVGCKLTTSSAIAELWPAISALDIVGTSRNDKRVAAGA